MVLLKTLKTLIPAPLKTKVRRFLRKAKYVLIRNYKNKWIWWGNLRRLHPVSDVYGMDRGGESLDRHYIDNFISVHKGDIQGTVLELLDRRYTAGYGGDNVKESDILDIDSNNKKATIVADLAKADSIADNTYDCFILTQTLQLIYDLKSAIFHAHRILKPGGVVLATVPSVSRIDCVAGVKGDYWRFTAASAERLFLEFFKKGNIKVEDHGNVMVCVAFLMGLAEHEVKKREFDHHDENFPLVICIRAVK